MSGDGVSIREHVVRVVIGALLALLAFVGTPLTLSNLS